MTKDDLHEAREYAKGTEVALIVLPYLAPFLPKFDEREVVVVRMGRLLGVLADEVERLQGRVDFLQKVADDAAAAHGRFRAEVGAAVGLEEHTAGDLAVVQMVASLRKRHEESNYWGSERELALQAQCDRLHAAITEHHAQKADDRCIEDDDRLYAAAGLPPCDRRVGDKFAMLRNCARFIEQRCEDGGWPTYVELEQEHVALTEEVEGLRSLLVHCFACGGWEHCGYAQMTDTQKALFGRTLGQPPF